MNARGKRSMINRGATSLTAKQTSFIDEFMKGRNGTQAAIRAGYAPGSAKVTASRLLTKANVAAEIRRLEAKHAAAAGIEVVDILKRLQAIAWDGRPSCKQVTALNHRLEHVKGQAHSARYVYITNNGPNSARNARNKLNLPLPC